MDLVQKVYQAGIVGEGGAGFPTFVKLRTQADHLLVNAAECEPLLFTDQYIMRNYADEIVGALDLCRQHVQAKQTVIAIKHKYEEPLRALRDAISRINAPISIFTMDSFYPAGDEQSIIFDVLGRAVPPGKLPMELSAVVMNVGTLRNVWRSTHDEPVVRKIVTLNGAVAEPKLIDVPIGTPIRECIALAGGAQLERYVVILGGPMMGRMVEPDGIDKEVVTKTLGGILVLPYNHALAVRRRKPIERIRSEARAACIQCNFCTELCPRYLKGHPLRPHEVMRSFALNDPDHPLLAQATLCCECGICELYACPMGLSPRIVNAHLRVELRSRKVSIPAFESEGNRPEHDVRKLPTERVVMRTDLLQWYERGEITTCERYEAQTVSIPTRQGVGRPAIPVVEPGDVVAVGQLIADLPDNAIGARMHASISGVVQVVTEDVITISAKE